MKCPCDNCRLKDNKNACDNPIHCGRFIKWYNKREKLVQIIRKAFNAGEFWGVCYSTWFTPSAEDTEEQIQKAIVEIIDNNMDSVV